MPVRTGSGSPDVLVFFSTENIMKFSPSLVFASAAILQMTTQTSAAPPGIERFLTVAGPANCGGNDLFTIGFLGTTGAPCTSLADGAATDFWVEWELFNCTVDLFAEAGCPDGSLVLNIPAPAVPGSGGCTNAADGFRALNVTCF